MSKNGAISQNRNSKKSQVRQEQQFDDIVWSERKLGVEKVSSPPKEEKGACHKLLSWRVKEREHVWVSKRQVSPDLQLVDLGLISLLRLIAVINNNIYCFPARRLLRK